MAIHNQHTKHNVDAGRPKKSIAVTVGLISSVDLKVSLHASADSLLYIQLATLIQGAAFKLL